MIKNFHENPSILHVGCEEPHAYFIPYHSKEAAAGEIRERSERFRSLCGTWDFKWFPSPSYVDEDITEWDELPVPMSWQMALGKGYDTPFYDDTNYPFPVNPPFVPSENPCGVYRKLFEIDGDALEKEKIYLVFEGVDSCFYLYINGEFVGYSQVSHNTSEFYVNHYLHDGVNEIRVFVLKWCDGSYLEDQDKIRLSGIFREVYLLFREPIHLRDAYIKAPLNEELTKAEISAELSLTGDGVIFYTLCSPEKKTLAEGALKSCDGAASLQIPLTNPILWTDETPNLYELYLKIGEEHFFFPVGIRRFEIKGRVIYVNGKAVKGKGVNRHDSHPELGAAVTYEHMLKDLYIFKANNINMIRTAHYPNDPRFLGLCDRLGFYVCNEADAEAHGMDFAEGYGRNSMSDDPEWTEAYVDRGRRLMEEDKNHPCVLMWSVGNESGIGRNLKAIADYFHTRMPGCIVHSERYNFIEYLLSVKNPDVEGFERYLEDAYIDIDSMMYASPEGCVKRFLNNETRTRPFFLCEFCHAMGNGPGDLAAYWDLIWKHESFFGGCVWEFCDHAVNAGSTESPKYLYGGDFGEVPNGKNFCADGLVYPDRRLHSGMLEYRQAIRPCVMTDFCQKTGKITLRNRKYFTDLSDIDLFWSVEENGKTLKKGKICKLDIPAQSEKVFSLPIEELSVRSKYCYLNISYKTNKNTPFAPCGHEVGHEQLHLSKTVNAAQKNKKAKGDLSVYETRDFIAVTVGKQEYRIDKRLGTLSAILLYGENLLNTPVDMNIWRAPTDNDRNIRIDWERLGYNRTYSDCRFCAIESRSDNEVVIASRLTLCATSLSALADVTVRYTVSADGGISCSYDVALRRKPTVTLPRIGVAFKLPCGFESLRYFGLGPVESYQDKRLFATMGMYETSVTEHFEHYIVPQENMAHDGTVWCQICRNDGTGLLILASENTPSFSFNCSHYTPKMLTEAEHDFELSPLDETVVSVDFKQCGIGSNSCGPTLSEEYALKDTNYSFSFRFVPTDKFSADPFSLL